MLTFSEEMLVLLLEDAHGTFVPIPRTSIECALAGAVLMDLAFANRIDTDLETLMVTDRTPTGILMLGRTLREGRGPGGHDRHAHLDKGARGRGRGLHPRAGAAKAPPARHPGAAGS